MKDSDNKKYYSETIHLARLALKKNEVPIGAVIVDKAGVIIGRGYNQTHLKRDGLKHAELVAIQSAQRQLNDWRLDGASLYVTLEPCLMCLGAAGNARVKNIYYVLTDPLFGSIESKLSKSSVSKMYPKLNCQRISDDGTVAELMKEFFKKLRNK